MKSLVRILRDALQKQLGPAVLIRYNRKGDLTDVTDADIAAFHASVHPQEGNGPVTPTK